MTLLLAVVLLGLILEDYDFLTLAMLNDFALGGYARNHGFANLNAFFAAKHQHLKRDFSTDFGIELLNENLIANRHLILFAAGTDNSVHVLHLLLPISPTFRRWETHAYKADAERLTKAL